MEKQNLQITKDNYEGYLEYYQYDSFKDKKIKGKFTFIIMICLFSLVVLGSIFNGNTTMFYSSSIISATATLGVIWKFLKDDIKNTKEMFQKKYPYFDKEKTDEEIGRALEKAKVIKFDGSKVVVCTEEFLKSELENKKYEEEIEKENIYEIKNNETLVPDQTLEQPKNNMELEITEKNYKGYLDFYLAADKEREKKLSKIICIFGMSYLVAIFTSLFSTTLCIGIAVCSTINFIRQAKKHIKKYEISDKVKKSINEKYPYVNTEKKYKELCQALLKKGIVRRENYEELICEKEYLNYVECEEIKKELLNERLYETTIRKPIIADKELKKAKIKVKKLIYPAPHSGRR